LSVVLCDNVFITRTEGRACTSLVLGLGANEQAL